MTWCASEQQTGKFTWAKTSVMLVPPRWLPNTGATSWWGIARA